MVDYQSISIVAATEAAMPEIVELFLKQQTRQHVQNPSLRKERSRTDIEMALRVYQNEEAIMALDREGRVRSYAQPSVWELNATSILFSFLSARNGIVQNLILPDPADKDAAIVSAALLTALDSFWRKSGTSGDLIRWPSSDNCKWWDEVLDEQRFQLDSMCAFRPLQPFFVSQLTIPSLDIRAAKQDDEEALVALFQEELHFHERYTPFVRRSDQGVNAFRRALGRAWKNEELEEGAPLVLVAERAGRIVAMVESTLLTISSYDQPGFTPPGRYCCLDNMCVHQDFRGQGIGRLLLQTLEEVITSFHFDLEGYMLWFNPANPSATQFWPRVGFQPLWTTYQRLHGKDS
ncbi:GNAT family N-acetyltransferase [Ktedonobacteria bacterium brp13]|nr:GNAT family N-acetyltransferase [Ktedonobacteria bacterium brp13]